MHFHPLRRHAALTDNLAKYIKIAALLNEKTVRDVALRVRWMTVSVLLTPLTRENLLSHFRCAAGESERLDCWFNNNLPYSQN